jgi:hypothetical protein
MHHSLYSRPLCCIIIYTTLGHIMGQLIGTFIAYFRGFGGSAPVSQVVMSPKLVVSTTITQPQLPGNQAHTDPLSIAWAIYTIMRHSLYYCKCLVYSGIQGTPPSPQSTDTGRGVGWRYPSRISKFFQNRFPLLVFPKFLLRLK